MINIVDIIVLVLVAYLVWQGLRIGFIGGLLNVLTTIASFLLAVSFYSKLAPLLASRFGINENFALVISFFTILIVGEIVFSLILSLIYKHFAGFLKNIPVVASFDKILGIIPSVLVGLFLANLLMLLILTLPVKSWLREPIQDSWWGKNVVVRGTGFVPVIEDWLDKTPYKNLVYLLTPTSPNSRESQTLNVPAHVQLKPDPQSEEEMLKLVNKERVKKGLRIVIADDLLREVGRAHCEDMFRRNYFSHYTPDGKDPFDRMEEARIEYVSAGENLAYAPSVVIAHEGLMNSKGHRENILRESFGKLGVGVIDAGIHGKMFCQEFTN